MKNILILLVIVACVACQNKPNKANNSEKTIPLTDIKGTQILKDYFEIEQLYVVDSLLLAKNNVDSNKKAFSVFNKAGKLLVRFGRIGQGPNDFGDRVTYFNQMFYNEKGNICIWFYERNYQRMRMINLSKTIKNKAVVIEKKIKVPRTINLIMPYYIHSSLIIGSVSNLDLKMDKLRFYNPQTQEIVKRVALLPKVETAKTDMATIQYEYNTLFVNQLCYQPNRGFVSALEDLGRIDFMNIKGEITKTISDNKLDDKTVCKLSHFPKSKDRIVYCCGMTTTNKYVFVLYNGKNNFRNIDRKDNVIRVFDWNGNEKFQLQAKEPLIQIAVNEAENIIYGVTEDYDVYKYKVKLP